MRNKKQTPKKISEHLAALKALRYWVVKWGYGKVKLYYPPRHRRFAERYRKAIEEWLKYERVMEPHVEVLLFPKVKLK